MSNNMVRFTMKEHLTTPAQYGDSYIDLLSIAAGKKVTKVQRESSDYHRAEHLFVLFEDGTSWVYSSVGFEVDPMWPWATERGDLLWDLLCHVNKAPPIDKVFIRRRLGL